MSLWGWAGGCAALTGAACVTPCVVVLMLPDITHWPPLRPPCSNKPMEDQGMLVRVAEVTQGWSAAALANLMNEAAILTVGG